MTLVGKKAPLFSTKAVVAGQILDAFSLKDLLGRYVLLFFYPLDFTFVCPTELHAFEELSEEFAKRETHIIGCSVDSCYTHLAWSEIPKEKGGISGITYPILSDLNKEIARAYQVLKEDEGIAYRAQFLIDRQGIVRHQLVNDLPIGRSVNEALRLLDALIYHEQYGEVCPANWQRGSKTLSPTPEGLVSYFGN